MRIIAGRLGGRLFDSPGTHKTHPMSDRVRGALFNILGDVSGLSVLDAFAGSGALSFEAISRGAARAVALESDRLAQKVIAENIESLGVEEETKLIKASAGAWLSTSSDTFDIVICDPPYNDLQPNLLAKLVERVTAHGTFVLSWPGRKEAPEFEGFQQVEARSYGDAQLFFFARR